MHWIIYTLIVVAVFIMMFGFLTHQMNGAALWEEYYAREIVRVINALQPGDRVQLDVHKGTEIAQKNEIEKRSDIFQFDSLNNEVCVKLSVGRKSCYSYFNDVVIANVDIVLDDRGERNVLVFEVRSKEARDE